MKINKLIFATFCFIFISSCFPITYFFEEKCNIGAGMSLFAYYIVDAPPAKFDSIYMEVITRKHQLFPDSTTVKKIVEFKNKNNAFLETGVKKYTMEDFYKDTSLYILTNKDRDFLYLLEPRPIAARPRKTSILVTSVSSTLEIDFRALGFTYEDKLKATKDFERDILPFLNL